MIYKISLTNKEAGAEISRDYNLDGDIDLLVHEIQDMKDALDDSCKSF